MKKYFILIAAMFVCLSITAQQKMSCCAASATESFSQLASDKAFISSHINPLPFMYQSENGKDITYKAADGRDAFGWEIKAKSPTKNYLFVFQKGL